MRCAYPAYLNKAVHNSALANSLFQSSVLCLVRNTCRQQLSALVLTTFLHYLELAVSFRHTLPRRLLLGSMIVLNLFALTACKQDGQSSPESTQTKPKESADEFVARVNKTLAEEMSLSASSAWLSATYINDDSARVASAASERSLKMLNEFVEQAKQYEGAQMSPESVRTIALLKLGTSMPAPRDPAKLRELTEIATRMDQMYGAGEYCTGDGKEKVCKQIGELSEVLANDRDYDKQKQAWEGWHTISIPMRKDYQRFVELVNEGAKEMGYADAGAMWRSGYDMPANDFQAETDRLWDQVKPLYNQLHCYTREKLTAKYGNDKGQVDGKLPAHLMGNLWQQDWGNLWSVLQPYPGAGDLNVTAALQAQRDDLLDKSIREKGGASKLKPGEVVELEQNADLEHAKAMTKLAEGFYTDLGMPALPATFWDKAQFTKPRDRNVVCHASAWQMNPDASDVRIKMCITPTEEELTTIYHELGHVYYYLAYKDQPVMFQTGAHDGFHEAIGDTIVLSMTPEYLASLGLVKAGETNEQTVINNQMRQALAKVAFLPFGLMIDRWRWGVFDGSITPENYNKAWWELKAKYQGVAPADARDEGFFDPGAKYHVPGNTPYTRYFLSHILQFQFYKALCNAAGHKGPLYQCNFANNAETGKRFWTMLGKGASQPWPQTMKELTGTEKMDGSAVLEYFAPLQNWLEEQNKGKTCGW